MIAPKQTLAPAAVHSTGFAVTAGWANEAAMVTAAVEWLRSLGLDAVDASNDYVAMGRAPDIAARSVDGKIWTVEAKMRDWRRALRQSRDHRIVSDFAYVLFPRDIPHEPFVELGIGIMRWTAARGFERLVDARQSECWEPARAAYAAFFWPNIADEPRAGSARSPKPQSLE